MESPRVDHATHTRHVARHHAVARDDRAVAATAATEGDAIDRRPAIRRAGREGSQTREGIATVHVTGGTELRDDGGLRRRGGVGRERRENTDPIGEGCEHRSELPHCLRPHHHPQAMQGGGRARMALIGPHKGVEVVAQRAGAIQLSVDIGRGRDQGRGRGGAKRAAPQARGQDIGRETGDNERDQRGESQLTLQHTVVSLFSILDLAIMDLAQKSLPGRGCRKSPLSSSLLRTNHSSCSLALTRVLWSRRPRP